MLNQVAVLMAVHDGEAFLRPAIDSILGQSFADFELLVIDDGSIDGTRGILDDYAKRDRRIRILWQSHQGLVTSLNRGLHATQAAFLARMDADDVALPGRLLLQVREMQHRPRLLALGGQAKLIDHAGRRLGRARFPVGEAVVRAALLHACPILHSVVMLRRSAALAVGGYRAAFCAAEDYDLWLRLAEHGEIDNLDAVIQLYRRHSATVTRRRADQQALASALALEGYLARTSGRVDDYECIAQRARSRIEAEQLCGDPVAARRMQLTYNRALVYSGALEQPWAGEELMRFVTSLRPVDLKGQRPHYARVLVRAVLQFIRVRRFAAALKLTAWLLRHMPLMAVNAVMSRRWS